MMQYLAAMTLVLMISRLIAVEPECATVYEVLRYREGKPLKFNCSVPPAIQTQSFLWHIESTAPYSLSSVGHCAEWDHAMMTCQVDNATTQYQTDVILEYISYDASEVGVCDFNYRCIFYIPDNESTAVMETSSTSTLPTVILTSIEPSRSTGPTPQSSSSPGGTSINAVVAGVSLAGVIVVLILTSGVIFAWCINRGKRYNRKQQSYLSDVLGGADNSGFLLGAPEEEEEKLTFSAIVLMDLVHNGTFKVVHHGLFNTRNVIVKQLRDKESKLGQEELSDEISFIEELTEKAGQHPSILGLVGVTRPPDTTCLVLEYVPHGTLKSFLHSLLLGPIPNWYLNHIKGSMADHSYQKQVSKDLMRIIEQIANGANFLTQNGCCHGDLSIRNVVLGDKLLTKLTNFGIKRTGHYYSRLGLHNYLQDMAPETLDDDDFSAASDVWSFGTLVFRLAALGGLDPYQAVYLEDLCYLVQEGVVPPSIPSISNELYFLLRQCWRLKKWERPNLGDIVSHLSILSQSPHSHLLLKVSMKRKGYISNDGQAFLHPPPQSVYHGLHYTAKPSQRMSILANSAISMTENRKTTGLTSEDSVQSTGTDSEDGEEGTDGYTLPLDWVTMMQKKLSEREKNSAQHLHLILLEHKNPSKRKISNHKSSKFINLDSYPSDSGHWSPRTSDEIEHYHENLLTEQLLSNEPTLP